MIYNLEYEFLDSLGRAKKTLHYGVFATIDQVEEAKQTIMKKHNTTAVNFKVHIIENLFSKVSSAE